MYTEAEEKILLRATKENGCLEQCFQAQEEAGELIQAINKFRRIGGIDNLGIHVPNQSNTFEYIEAYNNLCSEVADMEVMVKQLRSMLRAEQVDLIKSRKIIRLEKRLNLKNGNAK